ncbi:MAG: hypothetical protein F4114_13395 [Rhodospirillaceae bacterium]|nr:hypothetical protein [Rhodospirillaceae bacterium]MYB14071.1 hypothetical protein [Rhodospirillaceae bacterium]MYI50063.1 hypothetical protein [Rhodospirillaceae bacterium]
MKLYEPGTVIEIPCSIAAGAFPTEYFVAIPLDGEVINGFVPTHYISENVGSSAYIPGTVERVAGSTLTIRMPGSYFTTSGIADISRTWAERNVRLT